MIERPFYSRICKTSKDYEKTLQFLNSNAISVEYYPCEFSIKKWKPRRSEQANRYLWSVVYAIISQETGNDVNDLHEYFLGEFFGWEEYDVMGRKRLRPRERSAKQSKARFSEFIEFIISKAATMGIVVPPPELVPHEAA